MSRSAWKDSQVLACATAVGPPKRRSVLMRAKRACNKVQLECKIAILTYSLKGNNLELVVSLGNRPAPSTQEFHGAFLVTKHTRSCLCQGGGLIGWTTARVNGPDSEA